MTDLAKLHLFDAVHKIKNKEIKSVDLVQSIADQIEKLNPTINAYVRWDKDAALEKAHLIDKKIINNEKVGQLAGVPIAIKDLTNVAGEEVTCCSKILEGYISPYNATIIDHILAEDGIPFGRTNMDEFAMGSSNETSYYGPVKNPWNLNCVPGGSSGGAAACIASNMAIASIGSDTGGSIRQPAALCGVYGLKPTYGRVSRYGLVAFASSLDQYGPLTKSVKDAALLLNVLAGHDGKDSTSLNIDVPDFTSELDKPLAGLKMGVPQEFFSQGLDPEILSQIEQTMTYLESLGVQKINLTLPHATEYAVSTYYIVATAEASSNLARFDGVQYGHRESEDNLNSMYEKTRGVGFGKEVKRRIALGTYVLSSGYYDAYYLKAQKVRTLICNDFKNAFKQCDFIVTPTSPNVAFELGSKLKDPLQMYLSDIYTISANLAGIPGMSVPVGLSKSKLPIGVQLLGPILDEKIILNVAQHIENEFQSQMVLPEASL